MEEFDDLQGFLEHVALVMEAERRRQRRARQPDDAARRQGAGVRHRVPARLGGRPVPEPARARRERPRRPRGGAPPRLCRPDPRAARGPRSTSPRTAASTACGSRPCRRASSTNCREDDVEVDGGARRPIRMAGYGVAASTACAPFGSSYDDAGLAARPGPRPGRRRAASPRAATSWRHGRTFGVGGVAGPGAAQPRARPAC